MKNIALIMVVIMSIIQQANAFCFFSCLDKITINSAVLITEVEGDKSRIQIDNYLLKVCYSRSFTPSDSFYYKLSLKTKTGRKFEATGIEAFDIAHEADNICHKHSFGFYRLNRDIDKNTKDVLENHIFIGNIEELVFSIALPEYTGVNGFLEKNLVSTKIFKNL